MQDPTLVLRDIHQPPAPPWWPPAPGWWVLAALLLLAAGAVAWFVSRRRRHRAAVVALFDREVQAAPTAADEVAAISELLRRAARRRDPQADRLHGEAWLAFLDGVPAAGASRNPSKRGTQRLAAAPGDATVQQPFSKGPGRLLLEGGYRRDVDAAQVAQLRPLARARFLDWMAAK